MLTQIQIDDGTLEISNDDLNNNNFVELVIKYEKEDEESIAELCTVSLTELISALQGFETERRMNLEREKEIWGFPRIKLI